MTVLAAAAILQLASVYGDWDPNVVVWLALDAGTGNGESSGRTDALNPAGPYRGILQIADFNAQRFGYEPEQMYDPRLNVDVAHRLWLERGFAPWPAAAKYPGRQQVTTQAFTPDYPGAIVVPAHPTNYYRPEDHGGVPNKPRGWVLHTPEEDADNVESTPTYFQGANRQASTIYYLDNDGDVYQLVPERCAAIANGVIGKPYPAWADHNTSLNWQTLNVEIEGRAASIHQTMLVGGPQFNSLVRLIRHRSAAYGFPCDRAHVIGHYEVSNERSDPGPQFPWNALMAALQGDEIMTRFNSVAPRLQGQQASQANPIKLTDFNPAPPAGTKRLSVEVYIAAQNSGRVEVKDSDGKYAGQVGWDGARYGVVEVDVTNGQFTIEGQATLAQVGIVAVA